MFDYWTNDNDIHLSHIPMKKSQCQTIETSHTHQKPIKHKSFFSGLSRCYVEGGQIQLEEMELRLCTLSHMYFTQFVWCVCVFPGVCGHQCTKVNHQVQGHIHTH